MLTPSAVRQAWEAAVPILREGEAAPIKVLDIVAALETATSDLAAAIGQHKLRYGDTSEIGMARASLAVIDERLHWVRRNCANAGDEQIRHELEYARHSAFAVLVLLRRQRLRQLHIFGR